MYTAYILYSEQHHKIYIGYTSNLVQRFYSHNIFDKKGWTVRYRPWVVVYCEYFETKHEAMGREKQLKGAKGREWVWMKIGTDYQTFGYLNG